MTLNNILEVEILIRCRGNRFYWSISSFWKLVYRASSGLCIEVD